MHGFIDKHKLDLRKVCLAATMIDHFSRFKEQDYYFDGEKLDMDSALAA